MFIKTFIKDANHSVGQCRRCKCKLIYSTHINCNLTVNKSIECKVLGKRATVNCLLGLD